MVFRNTATNLSKSRFKCEVYAVATASRRYRIDWNNDLAEDLQATSAVKRAVAAEVWQAEADRMTSFQRMTTSRQLKNQSRYRAH
jgi:hypothetical protein